MLPQKIIKETCKFGTQQNFHVKRQFFFTFLWALCQRHFYMLEIDFLHLIQAIYR
jgi:hypothetical protein